MERYVGDVCKLTEREANGRGCVTVKQGVTGFPLTLLSGTGPALPSHLLSPLSGVCIDGCFFQPVIAGVCVWTGGAGSCCVHVGACAVTSASS